MCNAPLQSPDGEGEVGVGVGFVFEDEVPPFFGDGFEAVAEHDVAEQHTVGELLFGEVAAVVGVRLFAEPVEAVAHVDIPAGFHVHECQVDDGAAGVAAPAGNITPFEDDVFVEIGIEPAFGQRVGHVFAPAAEVVDGHLRPVGVPDLEAVAACHHFVADALEGLGSFAGHQGNRLFVAIDARSHEVEGAVVADFQDDVGDDVGQDNEAAGIGGVHRAAFRTGDLLGGATGGKDESQGGEADGQSDEGDDFLHGGLHFLQIYEIRCIFV